MTQSPAVAKTDDPNYPFHLDLPWGTVGRVEVELSAEDAHTLACAILGAKLPEAWRQLIEGLALLAQHPTSKISPLHCEHDELTVLANPAKFTPEELEHLGTLGFRTTAEDEEVFVSYRFGSA